MKTSRFSYFLRELAGSSFILDRQDSGMFVPSLNISLGLVLTGCINITIDSDL